MANIKAIDPGATAAIKPRYLDNLSEIADSADTRSKSFGKYSPQQILDASKKLNEREYLAFGRLSNDGSSEGIAKYAEAYLRYINQLSPEEQNGVRYSGTKQSVSALLVQARAAAAQESPKSAGQVDKPSSFLIQILDEIDRIQRADRRFGTGAGTASQVTISSEARRLLDA